MNKEIAEQPKIDPYMKTWDCPRCHTVYKIPYDFYRYCPKCGGKVVITHDVVDGLAFGFSVSCSRFCHYDRIHGTTFDTPEKDWYAIHYLSSKL